MPDIPRWQSATGKFSVSAKFFPALTAMPTLMDYVVEPAIGDVA
jgi:hypothetical protein